jgi:hypothetical protein
VALACLGANNLFLDPKVMFSGCDHGLDSMVCLLPLDLCACLPALTVCLSACVSVCVCTCLSACVCVSAAMKPWVDPLFTLHDVLEALHGDNPALVSVGCGALCVGPCVALSAVK